MKKIILIVTYIACGITGCKKNDNENKVEEVLSHSNGSSVVPNYLTFDQSFITMVHYSVSNLGAGLYMNSVLGNNILTFLNGLKSCGNNATCVTNAVLRNNLSVDTLDEYFYSAMAGALIFHVAHPEFDNMQENQRSVIFSQAFVSGMNSDDPRWIDIKNIVGGLLGNFYNDEIYKADPDWTGYVDCFMAQVRGIWVGAMALNMVVEGMKTGSITKAFSALKTFLKTGVGRALGWVGLAIMAWEIFDCCWDLAHSAGGGVSHTGKKQFMQMEDSILFSRIKNNNSYV